MASTTTTPYTEGQKAILEEAFKTVDTAFVDDAKYQKEWVPKIEKYLEDLEKGQPEELKLSADLVPKDLDSVVIDGLQLLYDSKALSEKELEITEMSAVELLRKIASRELTSVEVFQAFAHRCVIANQLTNFALQIFLDEGLERAQFLDKYIAENGKPIGPLHGLPLSIKEHIPYKGKISHASTVSNIDNIPEASGPILDIFEQLGVIYYVRTSQPQTIMHLDTDNNFIGRSRNPYNLFLSPGGSSGGEGACVAFGGSPLGIGSDIGGSIRGPAAFSGCWGLKPTSRRCIGIPAGKTTGNESVVPTLGPLARRIDDIDLFMDSFLNAGQPWTVDPWCIPIPWRKEEVPTAKNLKIGILYDDGVVKPFPPIERGLKYTAEKLAEAGVEVVEFKPHKIQEAYDLVHAFYTLDGNAVKRKALGKSGEPLKPLTHWYMSYGEGDKTMSIEEYHEKIVARDVLREDYLRLMNEQGLDFIISPASYNVAALPGKVFYWGYTSLWNIMDLPTLTFPTGLKQDPAIDKKIDADYKPRNKLEELELPNYDDPSLFKNAPICFQLTGRRYNDEKVVAAGKLLGEIFNTA